MYCRVFFSLSCIVVYYSINYRVCSFVYYNTRYTLHDTRRFRLLKVKLYCALETCTYAVILHGNGFVAGTSSARDAVREAASCSFSHTTFSFSAVGCATNSHECSRADTLQYFTTDSFLASPGDFHCGVRYTIPQQFVTRGANELLLCELRGLLEARCTF